ncbi:U3-containing 90S pre-ribosomal complex subunit-domain containing protein [Coniella lustricola]|uniref:U3-containing 90S pre-ribosomal complex subunit-domain containing protein n=1 Tax=Coniella lustricola TaxID=2025994 RepID=A0A2T3A8H0_9PEZI|nr:U3-containing 90S pre-ribosomal complex subunit-domain containing protein [Coniella lustricola]
MAKTQSKKRKAPIDDVTSETDTPAPTVPAVKKPKQKKNRRPDAEDEESLLDLDRSINTIFSRMDPDLLADYVAANTKRFGIDLSSIELSDLYVPAGAVKDTTGFAEPRVKDNLAAFLEAFAGSEEDKKRLGTAPKKCGSPHTIVVAGAGLRAADLVRSTRTFQKKENVVAKLFAKHFKVAEQVEFLKKNRTGIAIGTPARLMALLDEGALSIEHLKRIVVDASHIDQKKRGVMDMKETMMPLAQWLTRKEFKERYGDSDKPLELLFF